MSALCLVCSKELNENDYVSRMRCHCHHEYCIHDGCLKTFVKLSKTSSSKPPTGKFSFCIWGKNGTDISHMNCRSKINSATQMFYKEYLEEIKKLNTPVLPKHQTKDQNKEKNQVYEKKKKQKFQKKDIQPTQNVAEMITISSLKIKNFKFEKKPKKNLSEQEEKIQLDQKQMLFQWNNLLKEQKQHQEPEQNLEPQNFQKQQEIDLFLQNLLKIVACNANNNNGLNPEIHQQPNAFFSEKDEILETPIGRKTPNCQSPISPRKQNQTETNFSDELEEITEKLLKLEMWNFV